MVAILDAIARRRIYVCAVAGLVVGAVTAVWSPWQRAVLVGWNVAAIVLLDWVLREILPADEGIWLETEWRPPLPPRDEDIPTLTRAEKSRNSGIIDVVDGNVVTRELPEVADRMRLIEVRENWDVIKLVSWLDRNIPHNDLDTGVGRLLDAIDALDLAKRNYEASATFESFRPDLLAPWAAAAGVDEDVLVDEERGGLRSLLRVRVHEEEGRELGGREVGRLARIDGEVEELRAINQRVADEFPAVVAKGALAVAVGGVEHIADFFCEALDNRKEAAGVH